VRGPLIPMLTPIADRIGPARVPKHPTSAVAGTPEKIAVMRSRAARGEQLHHPEDSRERLPARNCGTEPERRWYQPAKLLPLTCMVLRRLARGSPPLTSRQLAEALGERQEHVRELLDALADRGVLSIYPTDGRGPRRYGRPAR